MISKFNKWSGWYLKGKKKLTNDRKRLKLGVRLHNTDTKCYTFQRDICDSWCQGRQQASRTRKMDSIWLRAKGDTGLALDMNGRENKWDVTWQCVGNWCVCVTMRISDWQQDKWRWENISNVRSDRFVVTLQMLGQSGKDETWRGRESEKF